MLHSLLPRDKHDVDRARALVEMGYPAVAPVLPKLVECLQDINWPVAHVLAPFLASIGEPLVPHVRHVLATEDDIWKYNVLTNVVASWPPEIVRQLKPELERLAWQPTANEVAEGVDDEARSLRAGLDNVASP